MQWKINKMATRFDSFLNSPNSKNLPPKRKVLQDYQDIRAKLTEIKKKHGVIDDSPSILDDILHQVSKDFWTSYFETYNYFIFALFHSLLSGKKDWKSWKRRWLIYKIGAGWRISANKDRRTFQWRRWRRLKWMLLTAEWLLKAQMLSNRSGKTSNTSWRILRTLRREAALPSPSGIALSNLWTTKRQGRRSTTIALWFPKVRALVVMPSIARLSILVRTASSTWASRRSGRLSR